MPGLSAMGVLSEAEVVLKWRCSGILTLTDGLSFRFLLGEVSFGGCDSGTFDVLGPSLGSDFSDMVLGFLSPVRFLLCDLELELLTPLSCPLDPGLCSCGFRWTASSR